MSGHYNNTLLVSKKPLTEDKDDYEDQLAEYFTLEQLQSKMENQLSYIKGPNDEKDFHLFKMIEIRTDSTLNTQYKFVHPRYKERQILYFNTHGDMMLEFLSHDRTYLYEKQVIGSEIKNGKEEVTIKWKFIRRMTNLNNRFGCTDYLGFVSPCFKYYIDVQQTRNKFIIRELRTEEEYKPIPWYLMNFKYDNETAEEKIKKVKWVGSDMLKILNQDGMEKLVDIGQDFKQINFNYI